MSWKENTKYFFRGISFLGCLYIVYDFVASFYFGYQSLVHKFAVWCVTNIKNVVIWTVVLSTICVILSTAYYKAKKKAEEIIK